MKNLVSKVYSAFGLFTVVLLAACGNANNCPNGQQMINNQCSYSQGVNGAQCSLGQLSSPQYGCLQANINGCTGNMGWSQQANTCVPGTQVTSYNGGQYGQQYGSGQYNPQGQVYPGYNSGVGAGYYYGVGTGYQNGQQCQNGFTQTRAYGCLPQGGCGYMMGMGPYGCTY